MEPVPTQHPSAAAPPPGSPVVDWITAGTRPGRTIDAAVPLGFARYATVVVPDDPSRRDRSDRALVGLLQAHGPDQPWWLGYLDTGVGDIVAPEQPRVSAYVGWPYVLLQGESAKALSLRAEGTPWHGVLPELLFPRDRSWLVSTLWDDDWRCIGGPAALVEALLAHPALWARAVVPGDDATPPGHAAL